MRSTIDSAGRIVVPKAVREALSLYGGTEVDIRVAGDHLEIEPAPAEISLVQKGSFVVAVPSKTVDKRLTVEEVEAVRNQITQERLRDTRSE